MAKKVHFYILGGALLVSAGTLAITTFVGTSKLALFGPTAQIYFLGIKNGLVVSTVLLFISFTAVLFFKKQLGLIEAYARNVYTSSSAAKKNIVILVICLLFAFGSHASNILNGYFNMDDFEIIGVGHTMPFSRALLMPHGNDHTIPLFRTEVKVLDSLFGQSQIPYSIFVFIMFSLIPFFTYLIFKRLGLGIPIFFIFLVLFGGAAGWADMLTGFYIMSIYVQILFFFCLAAWAHMAWTESKQKKYLIFFALALIFALTTDISGLWVIPAILLFMTIIHHMKFNSFGMLKIHEFP